MCSRVQLDVLFDGAVTNDYFGCLDAQEIPSCVIYHKSIDTRINQIIRKRERGGNGGLEQYFLQKNPYA